MFVIASIVQSTEWSARLSPNTSMVTMQLSGSNDFVDCDSIKYYAQQHGALDQTNTKLNAARRHHRTPAVWLASSQIQYLVQLGSRYQMCSEQQIVYAEQFQLMISWSWRAPLCMPFDNRRSLCSGGELTWHYKFWGLEPNLPSDLVTKLGQTIFRLLCSRHIRGLSTSQ